MKKLIALLLALLLLTGCGIRDWVDTLQAALPPAQTAAPTARPTEEPTTVSTEMPTEEPTNAPTQAPTEPETVPKPADSDLVRIIDYVPHARQALAYATEENFTGQVIYTFTDAYLRYGTVKKLAKAAEELAAMSYGILIWDGFRPVSAQAALWAVCPDATFVSHPVTGYRAHCRGNAVDLTLVDLQTGEPVKMPTGFDDFSVYADRDYSDCDPEAAENARVLETVMEKYGFKPYSAEWWHFTDTTDYPVDEDFDPAGVG